MESEFAKNLTIAFVMQIVVGPHVDVFGNEAHGTVTKAELSPTDVIAEGVVVIDRDDDNFSVRW